MTKYLVAISIFCFGADSSLCQTLEDTQKAMKAVSDFAEGICGKAVLEGESSSLKLNAAGKAELSKLVKTLADLKIDGAASYAQESYKNVVRADLAGTLKNVMACKTKIASDFMPYIPKPKY